jgi:hypothetical protein
MLKSENNSLDLSENEYIAHNLKLIEEKKQRRKEMKNEIYREANCLDKIKMNFRDFFTWLLYNDK